MELAGEIADGLHTACAYSPEALQYAVRHFAAGADRAGRDAELLDIGDSLLGAIAPDADAARRAGRIMASFYVPSMPPALLERHGIDSEEVAPVNEAFAAGDVERALDLTPDAVADRIRVAGTPDDWVEWLTGTYAPAGLNHALVTFADPFTLKAWADIEVRGLPNLAQQTRLSRRARSPPTPLALCCDLGLPGRFHVCVTLSAVFDLVLDSTFAGCRIEAVAGRGGMAVVYRATQLGLDRAVALKLVAPERAADASFRARFEREARVAAAIEHPTGDSRVRSG